VTAALSLAAAAAWVYWGDRVMAILPATLLVLLAVLVCLGERMPRSWLWLAGGLFAVYLLEGFTAVPSLYFLYQALAVMPWIILGLVVIWAAVDARPTMGMAVYFACIYPISTLLGYVGYGAGPVASWEWYLPLVGVAALAAGSTWRLRRQVVL
jgi:hypothetical protein